MAKPYYYVNGVVSTGNPCPHFQIMEETEGKQVCIAMVPFNKHINPKVGREPAMRDAHLIVRALNAYKGE